MSGGPDGLKHGELTEKIIGIFYEVYNELGYGFLESVYEESLVIALREAEIEHRTPVGNSGVVPSATKSADLEGIFW